MPASRKSPGVVRLAFAAFALTGVGAASLPFGSRANDTVIALGPIVGQLSPCGCTSPMSGGIRRMATIVRGIEKRSTTLFLSSGALVTGVGRQDVMKAETACEALRSLDVAAINLTPQDAALGRGNVLSMNRLSGVRFVASQLQDGNALEVQRWLSKDAFIVGGVTERTRALSAAAGSAAEEIEPAIGDLNVAAEQQGLKPVLILDGSLGDARAIAAKHPELTLIVYSNSGDAPRAADRVGAVWLVSAGDRAKTIVQVNADGSGFAEISLGPEIPDDPDVSRYYSEYLQRVGQSKLLEQMPRFPSAAFAGSSACSSCHPKDTSTWIHSAHSLALMTLRKAGHDRDPECVVCHTVGANLKGGFRSPILTPALSAVGCESCHGPSKAHALSPIGVRLPRISEAACKSCHTSEQSPGFNFATFWPKIRH